MLEIDTRIGDFHFDSIRVGGGASRNEIESCRVGGGGELRQERRRARTRPRWMRRRLNVEIYTSK